MWVCVYVAWTCVCFIGHEFDFQLVSYFFFQKLHNLTLKASWNGFNPL